MGTNFHTAWTVSTKFRASEMVAPLAQLDGAITLNRSCIVTCDGVISYNNSTGVLAWSSPINIYFVNDDGVTILNSVATGNNTVNAGSFISVTLNPINASAITITDSALNPNSASNFLSKYILLLGHRNTSTGKLNLINWSPTTAIVGTEAFDIHAYYPSTPGAGVIILRVPVARPLIFPADFAGSYGIASTAANATTDFLIKNGTTTVGTMSYAAAADTATFTSTGGVAIAFAAGDILSITAPGTPDTTLADVGAVITGLR